MIFLVYAFITILPCIAQVIPRRLLLPFPAFINGPKSNPRDCFILLYRWKKTFFTRLYVLSWHLLDTLDKKSALIVKQKFVFHSRYVPQYVTSEFLHSYFSMQKGWYISLLQGLEKKTEEKRGTSQCSSWNVASFLETKLLSRLESLKVLID